MCFFYIDEITNFLSAGNKIKNQCNQICLHTKLDKKIKITPKLRFKNEWTEFFEGKSVTTP